jgi:hypothetical protein
MTNAGIHLAELGRLKQARHLLAQAAADGDELADARLVEVEEQLRDGDERD